jgi:hypothetical protein
MTRQSQILDVQTGAIETIVLPDPTPEELEHALQAERAAMVCSPMQGMLALGEARWTAVQDYRDNHAAWAERVIIDRAGDWRRISQNIAFFQYLLEMTDEEVDDLFRLAMTIEA